MKHIHLIEEEIKDESHNDCVIHCVAEGKSCSCLICVKPSKVSVYSPGQQIMIIGLEGSSFLHSVLGFKDFYLLMLGAISFPYKMRIKEVVL